MDFDTFVLVAYSTNGDGNINYWNTGITDEQVAEETRQFHDLAALLSVRYPTKTFVLQVRFQRGSMRFVSILS